LTLNPNRETGNKTEDDMSEIQVTMTAKQWAEKHKELLDMFASYWEENKGGDFPEQMDAPDWEDEFFIWLEINLASKDSK
jgi:hypothetical protein